MHPDCISYTLPLSCLFLAFLEAKQNKSAIAIVLIFYCWLGYLVVSSTTADLMAALC